MGINEIIMYIMMFFMLIAAVDRVLSQFGGSARFLGKFGKSIEGSGGQFEEGFMAMGALGLAMVGMTALAPVLAHVLGAGYYPGIRNAGRKPIHVRRYAAGL
ncbi:ethanolamine utilization protein EutH [Salmonella enterica subsp. salamae]|uniref:Ethanolamine utilization protein EutH n=1 Tax=Salmonella enterica subsp. salamae TaxID=59202 RepID=A0A6D2G4W4_SALER|nr:ethanolamine utilization protein EutH [Salmonella enterica subsp. salamae]